MSSLNNSRVDFYGQTLIDLTNDTVTPETMLSGVTAHSASGDPIVGTAINVEDVLEYFGLTYYNNGVYVNPDQGGEEV